MAANSTANQTALRLLAQRREEWLQITSSTMCGISFVFSLFVLLSFWLFPGLRTRHPNNRIICNLAFTNTFAAVFQFDFFQISERMWPPVDMCLVEGIGNQFFYMASFCWIGCLALNIYVTIVDHGRNTDHYMKWYHLVSWTLPGASVAVLLYFNQFERWTRDSPLMWCWVKPGFGQLIFYVTLVLVILLGVVTTSCTIRHVLKKYPAVNRSTTAIWVGKVSAYIVVFTFVRMWSILNRATAYFRRDEGDEVIDSNSVFLLYLLHSLGSSSQGWALSAVFFWNENIFRLYKARCCTRRMSQRSDLFYYSANS